MIAILICVVIGMIIGLLVEDDIGSRIACAIVGALVGCFAGALIGLMGGISCDKEYHIQHRFQMCGVGNNEYLFNTISDSYVKYFWFKSSNGGCEAITEDVGSYDYKVIKHNKIDRPYVNVLVDKNVGWRQYFFFNGLDTDIKEFHIPSSNIVKELNPNNLSGVK